MRLSGIGRFGGPGYSGEMVVYRVTEATDDAIVAPNVVETEDYR